MSKEYEDTKMALKPIMCSTRRDNSSFATLSRFAKATERESYFLTVISLRFRVGPELCSLRAG